MTRKTWRRRACLKTGLTRDSAGAGSCLRQPGARAVEFDRTLALRRESTKRNAGRRETADPAANSFYSARSASTALTLAARAAGTAEAITAAARMVNADATNASAPG